MRNEEYLERQAEMNKHKKMQNDQSRERQEQRKIQERESGFNVYISGANEKRVAEQRVREKYGVNFHGAGSGGAVSARQGSQQRSGSRGGPRQDSRGARRRWLAPQGGEDADMESTPVSDAKKSNYQNPFSIDESLGQSHVSQLQASGIPRPSNQPSSRRKQWGAGGADASLPKAAPKNDFLGANFLDSNTPDELQRKDLNALQPPLTFADSDEDDNFLAKMKSNDPIISSQQFIQPVFSPPATEQKKSELDDEDDYSDSFEEVNMTVDTSIVPPQNQIEDLLKTATEDQLNILKQSLGNWADVQRSAQSSAQKQSEQKNNTNQVLDYQKNLNTTIDDEDYIEEDFEEDNSDSPIEDTTGFDQDEEVELILEQQRLIAANNRIQSTRPSNKPTRPISATYDLSSNLAKQQPQKSQSNLGFVRGTGQPGSRKPGAQQQNYTSKQSAAVLDKKAMQAAMEEENRRAIQSRRPAASATNTYKGPGVITSMQSQQQQQQHHHATSNLETIAERDRRISLAAPKVADQNPFATKGRPISQMLPKRPSEKSKTMDQQSLPKMTERQNFVGQQQYQQPSMAQSDLRVHETIQEHSMDESCLNPDFSRHDLQDSELKASMLKGGAAQRQQQAEQETVSIAELLGQIQKLEDTQRHQLYVVLKDMETSGDMSASNLQRGLQQFLTQAPKPAPSHQYSMPIKEQRIHNEVVLRVMSTLGNPHVCGITELELFDEQAERIPLSAACIMVRNQGNGPKVAVDKLINGIKLTKDEKQMWLGYLPTPPSRLEILIRFDKTLKVGGIKIWNYNKGILDCTKGVYEVQILVNDEMRWTGQLSPGKGQINIDYAKAIILMRDAQPGFALPKEDIPAPLPQKEVAAEPKQKKQEQPFGLSSAQSVRVLNQPDPSSQLVEDPRSTEERFRQYRSKLDLAQGVPVVAANNPVSGPIWLDQEPKPKQRGFTQIVSDYKRPSEFREGRNGSIKNSTRARVTGDDEDINDIVKGAVDSVNKAVMMSNSKRKEPRRPAQVDESLDSLDYFKVTNLGRFGNGGKDVTSTAKSNSRIVTTEEQKDASSIMPKKQQNDGDRNSQLIQSTRKPGGGPIIKGGALPEEFMLPSPARSIPSRKSKKEKEQIDSFGSLRVENLPAPTSFGEQHHQQQNSSRMAMAGQNDTQHVRQEANLTHNSYVGKEYMQGTREVQAPYKIQHDLDCMLDEDSDHLDQSTQGSALMVIPTLPQGKKLEINILETWGDMNYLGLTGIEVFNELGMPIDIRDSQILAFPPDVNVLPGYGTDPRTIEKLVDGQYFTNDDLHVWLTPFTSGEDHQISINLGVFCRVSMIRIWNYNKSRIHSYRGAKLIQMELDGQTIFRGEIKKAPGNTKNPEDCCEIILFTEEDAVLEMIDTNDWLNDLDVAADDFDNTQRITEFHIQEGQLEERPMTATKKFSTSEIEEIQFQLQQQTKPTSLFDERPMTSAIVQSQRIGMPPPSQLAAVQEEPIQSSSRQSSMKVKKQGQGLRGQLLSLNITQSWGDLFYVGLNGLEVLDERGLPIPITVERGQAHGETGQRSKTGVQAEPRDMNSIPGHGSDHRTLEKLFNGKNNTCDDRNMWLIPFNAGEDHSIRIDFGEVRTISSVKFYNYNKQAEDTLRGARQVVIRLDDALVTPKKGITLRVAPGTMNGMEDIGQVVKLPYMQGWTNEQIGPVRRSLNTETNQVHFFQEYEPIAMPIGFLFKINLYSTHGDLFYIGLNGIELYDQNGHDVCQTKRDQLKVYAHPAGVHTLDGMRDDIRNCSNLIDGQNRTASDNHIWLTPYKNTKGHSSATAPEKDAATKREPNSIILLFEQPVALSALRLWNYSKTPARGVNEFELEIDGHKIYRGFVRKAPEDGGTEGQGYRDDWSSVVLFQGDGRNADTLGRQINFNPGKVQSVLLMNEKRQMNAQHQKAHVNEKFVFDEQLRPQTKAFGFK